MRAPRHPGHILMRELQARSLSANRLALRVPSGRLTSIFNGKRASTLETALRLSRYFGNSSQFWMNLQTHYELLITEQKFGRHIEKKGEHVA